MKYEILTLVSGTNAPNLPTFTALDRQALPPYALHFVCLFFDLFVWLFICFVYIVFVMFNCLFVYLFVYLFVCFVCLFKPLVLYF